MYCRHLTIDLCSTQSNQNLDLEFKPINTRVGSDFVSTYKYQIVFFSFCIYMYLTIFFLSQEGLQISRYFTMRPALHVERNQA